MKRILVEQIVEMENGGIRLSTDGEKLSYEGPKDKLNQKTLSFLKENKPAIIELILKDQNKKIEPTIKYDNNSFPLTDVQTAYVLGRENYFVYGGVACHLYLEIEYETLDYIKTQEAWNFLIKHHEMLRMQLTMDKEQIIAKEIPQNVVLYWETTEEMQDNILNEIRERYGNKKYDIYKAPLFDVGLIKRNCSCDILFLSIDLMIADWTSIWLLIHEFEEIYFHDNNIPKLTLSFKNYVEFLEKKKEGLSYYRDYQFWKKKLDLIPEAPVLPLLDNQKETNKFKHYSFTLNNMLWKKTLENSKKHGITPTIAIMHLYEKVLRKWSENKDFSLNLTMLNRDGLHPEIENIVGDFTEISLVECFESAESTFAESAKALQKQLFENLDHKSFSGIDVIRELNKKNPLKKVLMPYVYTSAIGLIEKTVKNKYVGKMNEFGLSQTPQVFIDCQVMDDDSGLKVFWDVREGIFSKKLIEDMFSCFINQINNLSEEEFWITKNNIELPTWQNKERKESNNTEKHRKINRLDKAVFEACKKYPQKVALIDNSKEYSYEDLYQYSLYIREQLIMAGVKTGEYIGILLKKSALQVMAIMGVLCTNSAFVPIPRDLPIERKRKIIKNSNINIVIMDEPLSEDIGAKTEIYIGRSCNKVYKENLSDLGDISDSAYVIYTSGSTGEPKGVEITHGAVMNTILDVNERFEISKEDVFIAISKGNFDLSVYDIFGALILGGTLIIPENDEVNPEKWIKLIQKYKVTIWNSVPALMQILLTCVEYEDASEISSLKRILLSGDWIPVDLPQKIYGLLPDAKVVSMGGATEASIWSVYHVCKPVEFYEKSVPYGFPLSNQALYILDKNLEDCPIGVKGDLYIGGYGLAIGYVNRADLTEQSFIYRKGERLYKTGDKGTYLEGGEIQFLGREDTQVKINGYRVELEEINTVLCKFEPISQAVAVLSKNKTIIVAVVVNEEKNTTKEEIMKYLKKYLPQYMLPKKIVQYKTLPLMSNGKIDRKTIKSNYENENTETKLKESEEKRNIDFDKNMEEQLITIWREALGNPELKVQDNLYACGADSLIMAQMATKIKNMFFKDAGFTKIPFDELLRQLLNHPYILSIVKFLEKYRTGVVNQESVLATKDDGIGTLTLFHETDNDNLQILLHAGFGTMNCYRYLTEFMKTKNNSTVAGIAIKDSKKYCAIDPGEIIEKLADEYVELVLDLKRKKIQMIGYCVSGLIAVEIARRLMERGVQVCDLVLIDSHPIHYQLDDDLLLEMMFLPSLGIDISELDLVDGINSEDFNAAVLYLYNKFDKKIPENSQSFLPTEHYKVKKILSNMAALKERARFELYSKVAYEKAGNDFPASMCRELFITYKQSFKAACYEPEVYMGNARFLLAEEPSSFIPNNDNLTLSFWKNVCLGGMEIEKIAGNHITCMEDKKNAAVLCEILSKGFDENKVV